MSRLIAPPAGDYLDTKQIYDSDLGTNQNAINEKFDKMETKILDRSLISNCNLNYGGLYATILNHVVLITIADLRFTDQETNKLVEHAVSCDYLGVPTPKIFSATSSLNGFTIAGEFQALSDGKLNFRTLQNAPLYGALIYFY